MTTNRSETPSVQRASRPCFAIGCSLVQSRAQRTVGQRIDSQRWMAETAFSAIKRRFGPAVHSREGYRGFREFVLIAAVSNLEQALKT